MNTVVYQEPYKLPAGILAMVVHAAFFSLLYFGFSWQTQPRSPAAMSVELWQSLPEPAPAPPVKAIVETPPPVQVEEVVKPDIVIPEKKPKPEVKPVEKPPKKPEVKPEVKPKVKPEVKSRVKPEVTPGAKPGQSARPSAAEQQAARDRAEQEAATGRVLDEYTSKIATKIRRNTVMPPNVPNDARAEFAVTLLPGGTVLDARLTRSSGNTAYDNAVERAILKSQPLPLPPDAGMFGRFRELKLSFKPVE
jgi:colicin import membrane protein